MAQVISSSDFQSKVLDNDKKVLVDFFATWCGPCKRVAPTVDEIAQEKADVLDVYKVDIDASPDIAAQYGVMSVPTFIVFQGGKPVNQTVGALPKQNLLSFIGA